MWTRWTAPLANLYTPAIHPGESLEFDYTVGNAGFASSGDITTSFFLVGGPCFSGYFIDCFIAQPVYAGVYLDTQQFPPLAGNNWYWPRARIDTPAALAPGLYWVAWYSAGAAPEYYSGTSSACAPYCNNQGGIAAVPLLVADDGQLADLSVRGVDVQPRYALQGTLAEVTATVDNTGTFPTRPATVRIAIAAGGACAAATALDTLSLDVLQPGDSREIGATVRVPWNTPVGTARICVDADDEDEVRESDETNNGASLQIFIDYNEQIFANGFDAD
jgi:hypothetical protein